MQFHPLYEETSRQLEVALNAPNLFVFGRVDVWLKDGALPEEILDICPRVAKLGRWSGRSLNYFDGFIADAIAARTKPMPKPRPVDSERHRHRAGEYEPLPDLPEDVRDRIDQGNARLLNKGITVMSVTYQDAKRMKDRGWLNEQAAERFGL